MRRRLLVVLLGLVAAIWTAAALFSYFDARHELDEMFDAHLAQSASLLIAQAGHDLDEIDEHAADLHRYARRVAFQFWEDGRVLRLHSANAPSTRMSSQDEGFADVRIDGAGWRVFSGRDPSRRYVVQVGERASARDAIVGTMIRNMLWPLLFALPLLAIVVWIAIARVMRPLGLLNRQVVARAPDNLAPLALDAAPAEVAPLAANLNRLFERVRTSIASRPTPRTNSARRSRRSAPRRRSRAAQPPTRNARMRWRASSPAVIAPCTGSTSS